VEKHTPPPGLKWICIEGNIGAGKTTLANALAKKMKATLVEEKTEQNNLLNLFYEKPASYASVLEYSFLVSRYEHLSDAFQKNPGLLICDFSFYRSLIFGKVNLPEKEFLFFKKDFRALASQLPQPDLLIYLHTDVKGLQKNIAKRGRNYETGINDKYLEKIEKQYARKLKKLSPLVFPIKLKKYNAQQLNATVKLITQHIQQNFGGQKVKD